MRKSSGTGINVGSSSILVIFVLLCLTTFATLSMVSANADQKLTIRTAQAATQYYQADAAAEEILARIDDCLKSNASAANESEYLALCAMGLSDIEEVSLAQTPNSLTVQYTVPITDKRALSIAIEPLYPTQTDAPRYRIVSWQSIMTAEWQEDDSLNLWSGIPEL